MATFLADHVAPLPTLADWHGRAVARFTEIVAERNLAERVCFGTLVRSYRIRGKEFELLAPNRLIRDLSVVFHRLGAFVPSHSVFYPHNSRGIAPYFTQDRQSGCWDRAEILECVVSPPLADGVELWRVSSGGFATHIGLHGEDEYSWPVRSEKRFWPTYLTRNLADIVLHAVVLADRIKGAESVEFLCEWSGLADRELVDGTLSMDRLTGKIARPDVAVTRGEWSCAQLQTDWSQVVSALGGPVIRLFDPERDYSSANVKALLR